MTAARYPETGALVIEQGATFTLGMQLSTGGPVSSGGTPVDITGAEVRMHIRKKVKEPTAYFQLTSTGSVAGSTGIYVTSAPNGQFVVTIDKDDTTAITWLAGVYDLEVETAGGEVRRYLYGPVKVSPEVTR